jgi:alcohol/geraniol dehydrogenase (NADP+)
MTMAQGFAALKPGGDFEPIEYELPNLGSDDVEIDVESCGICHSDLSMLDNEWGFTQYPFIGGHEVIGTVAACGEQVPELQVGDRVGLGWFSRSCMHCNPCLSGDQNLCAQAQGTITHQAGGFADKVRCHWGWATKIPSGLDPVKCGPLLCGGVTAFNPLVQHQTSPLSKVAVIGIGGLGHMAIMFANAWGCEVTAISRSRDKEAEARELGAHHYLATSESGSLQAASSNFDLIINTTNADLPWDQYISTLAPRGVLHTVGAAHKVEATVFPMLGGQKSLSFSPLGSIVTTRKMLEFAARHSLNPVTEVYAMSDINDAFEKLRHGSPRYRLVLTR